MLASFATEATRQYDKTAWFEGKWGVFFHYLAKPAGTTEEGTSHEAWNQQINGFNVEGLADQLEEVGADYFVITLGQGSGLLLAKNEIYDQLTKFEPKRSPERDLVSELADALNRRGIRLMVYTAAGMGWADLEMRAILGMTSHHNDHRLGLRDANAPNDWQANREGQIEYLHHWQRIHEHWSKQWGSKVDGWWVDGCYQKEIRFPGNEPPNLETMKAALLAGNPKAIVTFNSGKGVRFYSEHEDYSAGEVSEISRDFPDEPKTWYEEDGHRIRLHVLTYLGEKWGGGEPRYKNSEITTFTKKVINEGGFITFDVPPLKDGLIPKEYLPQLKAIDQAVLTNRDPVFVESE
jgi:alpha-L-fucosidase